MLRCLEVFVKTIGQTLQQPIVRGSDILFFGRIDLIEKFFLKIDHITNDSVGKLNCRHHFVFWHFLGEALDHSDLLSGATDNHVQLAFFQIGVGWERNHFTVDLTNANTGDRALERQFTDEQGYGSTIHCQHVTVVLQIAGNDERLNLNFVAEPVGPQGADRAVHQSRAEDFLRARTALTLQESTWEFTGSG